MMLSSWRLLLALAVAPRLATSSFSLGTIVQNSWYYIDNHLAATTSQGCLDAYNANIDCDPTLLSLVSSASPNFNPEPADLERTCVSTCKDSLDAYVKNVQSACSLPNDAALVESDENNEPRAQVPVAVVGQIFQYQYAFSCSQNSTGWCYFNYVDGPDWADAEFPCDDGCAAQFFINAHELPGANYWFMVYDLADRSSWWETQWTEGWQYWTTQCSGSSAVPSSDTGTATGQATSLPTETTSGAVISTTPAHSSSGENTSSPSSSSAAKKTTSGTGAASSTTVAASAATNAAGRLRPPFRFFW